MADFKPFTLTVEEEERQALLLALALMSIERPGWDYFLGEIAEKLGPGGNGRQMYADFKAAQPAAD